MILIMARLKAMFDGTLNTQDISTIEKILNRSHGWMYDFGDFTLHTCARKSRNSQIKVVIQSPFINNYFARGLMVNEDNQKLVLLSDRQKEVMKHIVHFNKKRG